MERRIAGFHRDEEDHWLAEFDCSHNQHTRHDPPWSSRPWVVRPQGRAAAIGKPLNCKKCDAGEPPDRPWLRAL